MNEKQLANASLSIFADLYMGIFDMFPDFTKIVQDAKVSSYFEDVVIRDIDLSNNVTIVDPRNEAQRSLEIKLQEKMIPFEKVSSSAFAPKLKVNGNCLFVLRACDYERAKEAIEELQQEFSKDEELEPEEELEEEDLERSREDGGGSEAEENTDDINLAVIEEIDSNDDNKQAERNVSQEGTKNKAINFHSGEFEYTDKKEEADTDRPTPTSANYSSADGRAKVPCANKDQETAPVERPCPTVAGSSPSYIGNGQTIAVYIHSTNQASSQDNRIPSSETFGGANRNKLFHQEVKIQNDHENTYRNTYRNTYGNDKVGPNTFKDMAARQRNTDNSCTNVSRVSKEGLYGTNGGGYSAVTKTELHQRNNITSEILHQKSLHSVGAVLKSDHFVNILRTSKRMATQSVFGHDTDAGKVIRQTGDLISPVGKYLKQNYLKHGAILLNKDIRLNKDIFASAYAAYSGCSMKEAHRQTLVMTKSALLDKSEKLDLNMQTMEDFIKKVNPVNINPEKKTKGFAGMIGSMDDKKIAKFLENCNISNELKKKLLTYPIKELKNPFLLEKLLKEFGSNQDQDLIKMLKSSAISNRFGGASLAALIQGYVLQLFKRISRESDAGKASADIYFAIKYAYGAYGAGMKLLAKLLQHTPLKGGFSKLILRASDPLGFAKNKIVNSQLGKGATMLGRGFRDQIARTRMARFSNKIFHSVRLARQSLATSVKSTRFGRVTTKLIKKVQVLSQNLNKFIAQVVAKVGVALGWIAIVTIVIVLILTVVEANRKAKTKTGMVDIVTIQDTEILQEILTELTAKNEAFMAEINNAANHRGSYSSNMGFTANENVSFYETYHVVFRDSYGNELEPSHVDLNNSKTIISMATRFMPYVFTPLTQNPSEDTRKTYEDVKQHFKDYCNFLWAATHQISIEEYHPGDSAYSEVDNSGLITELSTGKCDKDGMNLWVQADFSPNKVGKTTCSTCSELPNSEHGVYGAALCSHGKNANEVDGWKKTGLSRPAINCIKEHHDGCDEDHDSCHSCSLGHWHQNHRHLEYEWVYECGGHMGNVVYVTIGELSRIPSLPAAKDVDYGAVAIYPGQEQETMEKEENDRD